MQIRSLIRHHYSTRRLLMAGGVLGAALLLVFVMQSVPQAYVAYLREVPYPFALGAYALAMFAATVVAPIGILPLVPTVALILGPWQTALASIIGWTAGAVIGFSIARRYGRPLVARFVSLERVEQYERQLSGGMHFWGLVVLRILVPVDFINYALGLVSTMPLWQYTLATAIGVTPLSVLFAYLGQSVTTGRYEIVGLTAIAIAVIGYLAYRRVRSPGSDATAGDERLRRREHADDTHGT